MALRVKKVVNKSDAELDVIDKGKKGTERIPPHSSKPVPNENLLDMTFISKTNKPIYIQIKSIIGNGGVGDGDDQVEVVVGDPEEEEDN